MEIKDIVSPLKSIFAKNPKGKSDVSKRTKRSQIITKLWQEKFPKEKYPEISVEVPISDKSNEKIDLVDSKKKIAYELKVSGTNPHHEFYKDILKFLVFKKNNQMDFKTFVFISEKEGINKIAKSALFKEIKDSFDFEIILYPIPT